MKLTNELANLDYQSKNQNVIPVPLTNKDRKDSAEHEFFSLDFCSFLKNSDADVSEEISKIQDNIEKIESFTNMLNGSINKFNTLPSTSSTVLRPSSSLFFPSSRLARLDYSKSCTFRISNFSIDFEHKEEEEELQRRQSEGGWEEEIDLEKKMSVKKRNFEILLGFFLYFSTILIDSFRQETKRNNYFFFKS